MMLYSTGVFSSVQKCRSINIHIASVIKTFQHLICASENWAQALVGDNKNSGEQSADAVFTVAKHGASILLYWELTTAALLVSNHSKNDEKECMVWTRYTTG